MKEDNILREERKFFLYRKGIIWVFGIFVFIFLAYFAYSFYQEKKAKKTLSQEKRNLLAVNYVKDENDAFRDSDGDGLYDWFEELYPNLDPHKYDTDGDGVSDGEYIRQKERIEAKNRFARENPGEELTESDKIARGLYMALYTVYKKEGKIDDATKQKISENVADYVKKIPLNGKIYLREDIKKVEDTKKNSFAYMKKMKELFKEYPIKTSEIMLIFKALKEGEDVSADLDRAYKKYKHYREALEKMEVPRIVAGRHTQLLNAVNQIEGAFRIMKEKNKDDLMAFSSIVQMSDIFQPLIDAIKHIQTYFEIIQEKDAFQ